MKNAIWYSPAAPTPKQRGQAAKMGYRFIDVSSGRRLAKRPANDHYDLASKLRALDALVDEADAEAVFGDFEPPLLHGAWMAHMAKSTSRVMLFSSWKAPIQTWHEGSPIVHKSFISVGCL